MARTKKLVKAKEPIKIRFKALSNGNKSIYLDVYDGGRRSYDFLKLYLVPEVDAASKALNANALQAAQAVKAQRLIDIANNKAGIKTSSSRSKMLLLDWIERYKAEQRKKGMKDLEAINKISAKLIAYRGGDTRLIDVNKRYCLGFIDFLQNTYISPKTGTKLSKASSCIYLQKFNTILNCAVRAEMLSENPMNKVDASDKIKMPESKREYLTIDEVKKLMATPMRNNNVKRAFLFGCFCGLRISDIRALTWDNIIRDGDQCRVEIRMQKTQELLYLPLSVEAQRWLPERGAADDKGKVFLLPQLPGINISLKLWAKRAGVHKHITFHTSRHTFATMLLTLGTDLYTTSKLLGHTNVSTTQIYAKIVNQKKVDAVSLIDNVFNK